MLHPVVTIAIPCLYEEERIEACIRRGASSGLAG
jgi:hypothetical protein